MREKIKRILDLVRAGKLTLEDAAPLLAALNARLALTESDRELVASLLARGELDTAQVAEHLLLLRGVKDFPQPPLPPRAPGWEGRVRMGGRDFPIDMEGIMDRVNSAIGRVGDAVGGTEAGAQHGRAGSARILRVQVESSDGDEYSANLPVSLAGHLHKLIPGHGIRALERAGLSLEALRLLIEADPPPGDLIQAEDSDGNSVSLTLK
ncbi:SHOCT-like domain-containing protein [Deinococcus budaensis]|uniref:YvlB/LiaX N-terminal domain-containing protein n=1 Tax=Deinococcus budaensis TaxID=1665626 RepID=A0A7W8LRR2_9DEIO|nr:hypothetical protein [Deinococcus budaensis]MBB5236089.1 hypothetical protein [Deinococcus budaensis]